MNCPLCGGLLALLGRWGRWLYFRCVDCGMDCPCDDEE